MEIKEMREALAGVVEVVPRSNEDAEKLYREKFPAETEPTGNDPVVAPKSGPIYTYIGAGCDSPQIINFMGKQVFMRGKAVEVTNEAILKKIDGNQCFVKGEVTPESLYEADQKAAERVAEITKSDAELQMAVERKYRG